MRALVLLVAFLISATAPARATTRTCYLRRRLNSPALQAKGTFYMQTIGPGQPGTGESPR